MFDLPLVHRVDSLRKYISQTDINTLSKNINGIIDNIFGHDEKNIGWNLLNINQATNPQVYEAVKSFLSPFGPLYDLLMTLSNNGTLIAPLSTIQNNSKSFGLVQGGSQTEITPLKLFFQYLFNLPLSFHLASFSTSTSAFQSSLFYRIFLDYLQHIFFLKDATRLIDYLSGTIQMNMINSHFNFRITDTFIATFVEVLLKNPNDANNNQMPFTPNTFQVYMVRTFIKHYYRFLFGNFDHIQVQSSQAQSILSHIIEHKRHLHDSIVFSGKENIDQNAVQSKSIFVMNNLANDFFHASFTKWPNDLTFVIVLDTWLVSAQPWRYATSSLVNLESDVDSDPDLLDLDLAKNPVWFEFILSQYPLYLVPTMLFLKRINTMDLLVEESTAMLKQLANFLANDDLKGLMKNAENDLNKDVNMKNNIKFSGFWSPDSVKVASELVLTLTTIKKKIKDQESRREITEDRENPNGWFEWFKMLLMIDEESKFVSEKAKIFKTITSAEMKLSKFFNIRLPTETRPSPRSSTIDWDRSDVWRTSPMIQSRSFSGTPRTPLAKYHMQQRINRKIAENNASNNNSTNFNLQKSVDRGDFTQNSSIDINLTPDKRNKSLGSSLDRSRFDLHNSSKIGCSFLDLQTDPRVADRELLPRSSKEIYFLFKLTTEISMRLNNRFGVKLRELSNQPGFSGIFFRRLFCGRICSINEMNSKRLVPRVRLRWMANKKIYIWFIFAYILFSLFNGSLCSLKYFTLGLICLKVTWVIFSCVLASLIGL